MFLTTKKKLRILLMPYIQAKDLNFEATALVADDRFAKSVEAMLQTDLALCEPVDRAHFDDKPLRFRVAARIARLASPLDRLGQTYGPGGVGLSSGCITCRPEGKTGCLVPGPLSQRPDNPSVAGDRHPTSPLQSVHDTLQRHLDQRLRSNRHGWRAIR